MNINEFLQKTPGFFATLKTAWTVYRENLKSVSILVTLMALPIYLFFYFGNIVFQQLPDQTASTYYSQTRAVFSGLVFIGFLGSLIDFSAILLLYKKLTGNEIQFGKIIGTSLVKYLKIFVTMLLALFIFSIPAVITGTILTIGAQALQKSVLFLILIAPLAVISVLALIYFVPTFFFVPLVCLIRDNWLVSAIKYSWKIVHKNWWRVFFLSIFLGVFNFIIFRFFALFSIGIVVVIALTAQKIAAVYGDAVYLLYMLKYEHKKGLHLIDQPK